MTTPPSAAAIRTSLLALRERKRILDGVSLLSVVIVALALAVPWFLRIYEVDLVRIAWLSFGYALVFIAGSRLADAARTTQVLSLAVQLQQFSLVVFLAVLWHMAGGVDNPAFLIAFLLPVVASGAVLVNWQPYATAALASLLAIGTAVGESADLRWYLGQFGVRLDALAVLVPELGARPRPFPTLEVEPAFLASVLLMFVVLVFATAYVAGALTTVLLRLADRLRASTENLEEARGLFHAILRAEPEPGLIVYADSAQVVHASDSFLTRMLLAPEDLVGKSLFELVDFAQPSRVRELLAAAGGEAPFCMFRVGPEARIANVSVHGVEHAGTRYAYVGFLEITEPYYLNAAFDAIDSSVLIIGADGRLRYANRAAEDVFGALHFGMEMEVPLALPGLAQGWWREATTATSSRVVVAATPFQVSRIRAPLPGESNGAWILTFRNIAAEETLLEQAVTDPLTGLHNRRFFDLTLPHHVAAASRGANASLALLDLDRLKPINDRFGHAEGDAALRAFVAAVQGELRACDSFARIGGDEFAVVFQDALPHDAEVVIDRIYRRLERTPLTLGGETLRLGFSAGVAAVRADEAMEELLRRADQCLYAAKSRGRGRCMVER